MIKAWKVLINNTQANEVNDIKMPVYVLNSFFILSLASLIQAKINSCEKKYFEVSINEDADFLGEVIYALLTNERCGLAKVQICPSSLSYTSPDSNYNDSAYKQWVVPGKTTRR